ncbi:MAG: hypothetical protein NZ920_01215 [Aigarchaeota archaeon]|nr:hypothetical protein [Aigarchaeota archaeon]MDW8093060.1 hypothetical protein [Nitrososphaerota archaeon]
MRGLRWFLAFVALGLSLYFSVHHASPVVETVERGSWVGIDEVSAAGSIDFLCSVSECRYIDGRLHYYSPRYEVRLHYSPEGLAVSLVSVVLSFAAVFYLAYKIENVNVKRLIGIASGVYGAALTILVMTRSDFRYLAPILLPLAAALMFCAVLLLIVLKGVDNRVSFSMLRGYRRRHATNLIRRR